MKTELASKLRDYLKPETLKVLKEAADIADREQIALFLVGGIVRDLLLERSSLDIDIVIVGDALSVADRLASVLNTKVASRSKFGTAKMKYSWLTIDLVTARRETYSSPGALPTVYPGNIRDDLFRRDFTVNAMAVQLNAGKFGSLVDPYHGLDDLNKGLIRILHDRSFIDDSTRILRAIRYEQRLGFRIETKTSINLRKNISMIGTVSPDRIKHELMLFFEEPLPEKAFHRADKLGVLARIHPQFHGDAWLSKHFQKARRVFPGHCGLLYLCLLIYRFTNNENRELLRRFNFTRTETTAMTQTLSLKSEIASGFHAGMSPVEIHRRLKQFVPVAIYSNLAAAAPGKLKQDLELYLSKLSHIKTSITGDDIVAMGISPGPKVRKYLEIILEGRLSGSIRSRKDEELFIRKLAK